MKFLETHALEMVIGFVAGLLGNTLASAFQNKYDGKDPVPCAKSGTVGGLVLGVVAVIAIIVQGALQ